MSEEKFEVSPFRSARWPAFAPVEMTGFFGGASRGV